MFELKIVFGGLLAFIPLDVTTPPLDEQDVQPSSHASAVWVLMVNAEKGDSVPCPEGQYYHEHRPYLRIPVKNVVGHKVPDLVVEGVPTVLIPISGYSIEVKPRDLINSGVELLGGRKVGSDRPESPEELMDFSWVPDLSRVAPGLAPVCANCVVADSAKVDGDRVSARFKLKGGSLGTYKVATNVDGGEPAPMIYNINPKTTNLEQECKEGAYCQAAAIQTVVRFGSLKSPVDLVFRSISEPEVGKKKIELRPAAEGDVIELLVVNQRPVDVLDHFHNLPELFGASVISTEDAAQAGTRELLREWVNGPEEIVNSFRWFQKLSASTPDILVLGEMLSKEQEAHCQQHAFPIPKALNPPSGPPWCPILRLNSPPPE